MSRTKTQFRSYAEAQSYVSKLHLVTMKDWIDFSKGNHPSGKSRPKDIPSNPWTIYAEELQAQGKKFSINEFLGSGKAPKKNTIRIASVRKTEPKSEVPAVTTKTRQRSNVALRLVDIIGDKPITYRTAKTALKKLHVKSQADFNALVRMKLLPKEFPVQPAQVFKSQWNGWKNFLEVRA